MQIKKFEALDMQEALRRIKEEMGPDAIILSSRKVRKGSGLFGLLGRSMVEVMAAVEPSGSRKSPERERTGPFPGGNAPFRKKEGIDPLWEQHLRETFQEEMKAWIQSYLEPWIQEVRRLRRHPDREDGKRGGFPFPWNEVWDRLCQGGLSGDLARRLVGLLVARVVPEGDAPTVLSPEQALEYAREALREQTRVTGPLLSQGEGPQAVVLVGPTGGGKTTTLAKLAAHYHLKEKRRVVLVTLDTYRIAAVEQLQIYGKIMGLPVQVALHPRDLLDLFHRFSHADLFLVDTAGRSQRDRVYLVSLAQELCRLQKDPPRPQLQVHLVLPATSSREVVEEVLQEFGRLPLSALLVTKLDEAPSWGVVFEAMIRAQCPLSYWTTGQRVPEDIHLATPEALAAQILPLLETETVPLGNG